MRPGNFPEPPPARCYENNLSITVTILPQINHCSCILAMFRMCGILLVPRRPPYGIDQFYVPGGSSAGLSLLTPAPDPRCVPRHNLFFRTIHPYIFSRSWEGARRICSHPFPQGSSQSVLCAPRVLYEKLMHDSQTKQLFSMTIHCCPKIRQRDTPPARA